MATDFSKNTFQQNMKLAKAGGDGAAAARQAALGQGIGAASFLISAAKDYYDTANSYTKNTFEAGPWEVPTSNKWIGYMASLPALETKDRTDFGGTKWGSDNDGIGFAHGGQLRYPGVHMRFDGGDLIKAGSGAASGATAGMAFGPIGAALGAVVGAGASVAGSLVRDRRADKEATKYNEQVRMDEQNRAAAIAAGASQIGRGQVGDFMRNKVYAGGGVLAGGNGVTKFEAGGSHEQNPYGGVPQGMAGDGLPNLVEEGEVKWDKEDYIFSRRLKPTKKLLKEHVLTDRRWEGKSYAEIAEMIQKGSEERENDPVARQTVDEMLGRLRDAQEEARAEMQAKELAEMIMAMSPEEQAALMQGVQQMVDGQGGMEPEGQGQAMMGMPQGEPSPEEQAMMEQQMAAQGQPGEMGGVADPYAGQGMMAYGGHLFDTGGRKEAYPILRLMYKNNPGMLPKEIIEEVQEKREQQKAAPSTTSRPYGGQYMNYDRQKRYYNGTGDNISIINNDPYSEKYINNRKYIIDNWDDEDVQEWLKNIYIKEINAYNKNRKGWKNYSLDGDGNTVKLTKELFKAGSSDGQVGAMHDGIMDFTILSGTTPTESIQQSGPRYYYGVWSGADPDNPYPVATELNGVAVDDNGAYVLPSGSPAYLDAASYWTAPNGDVYFDVPGGSDADGGAYHPTVPAVVGDMPEYPRYSWVPGAVAAGANLLGAFNRPDYDLANILGAYEAKPRDYVPIGGYQRYRPMDADYMLNAQRAQAAATRRALMNKVSPSVGAQLLAADYAATAGVGDTLQKVREMNDKQAADVMAFNRDTDKFNAEAANAASRDNFGLNQLRWDQVEKYGKVRDAATTAASEANSAAVSGFVKGLGETYKDIYRNRQLGWMMDPRVGIYKGLGNDAWGSTSSAYGGELGRRVAIDPAMAGIGLAYAEGGDMYEEDKVKKKHRRRS